MWDHVKSFIASLISILVRFGIALLPAAIITLAVYLIDREHFLESGLLYFLITAFATLFILFLFLYPVYRSRDRSVRLKATGPLIYTGDNNTKIVYAFLSDMMLNRTQTHNAIQEELKKLREGRVLFNPSRYMKVGKEEVIETRISKSLSVELYQGLKGRGEKIVEVLSVGDVMKANLKGSGFRIESLSSEAQVIPDDEFAHWTWLVTPVKSGLRTLTLLISVQLKIRGLSDTSRDMPVFERDVEVLINPVYTARRFLASHWKWIAGTIAIPPIVWIVSETGILNWLSTWLASNANSGLNPAP